LVKQDCADNLSHHKKDQALSREGTERGFRKLRESTSALSDFFNRVGPSFYSRCFTVIGYRLSLKHFMRVNHSRLGLRKGMRILDAGIGTGFLTVNLLKEAPVPLKIVGLDFSSGMLIGLNRWLTELGLDDRVKLHLADMRHMPFPDATFDLVITSAAMEYLPDVSEGISECSRVLQPGGRLLFLATRDSFMGRVIAATWRNKILHQSHVEECMKQAGFNHVESLRFPWFLPQFNWWGMRLLGEKAES
jgi:ubiquinone/menaquinone biosynthesis C-methylase UbiE